MIETIPVEMITMGVSMLSGFISKMSANARADEHQRFIMQSKQHEQREGSITNARSDKSVPTNKIRKFIVFMSFGMVAFLIVAGIYIQTNMIIHVPQGSFLGLFKWGGGIEIITVTGLVAYPWLSHMVSAIIGYYFGQGSAKRI